MLMNNKEMVSAKDLSSARLMKSSSREAAGHERHYAHRGAN